MSVSVEQAQARVTRAVIGLPGVAGTAVGLSDGRPCVKIMIERDDAALRSRLPRSEAGFPVRIEVTGPFSSQ